MTPASGNGPSILEGGNLPRVFSNWCRARPICFRWLVHFMRLAASRAFCTAGSNRPMSTAMMAITTNSSIKVNARRDVPGGVGEGFRKGGGSSRWGYCTSAACGLTPAYVRCKAACGPSRARLLLADLRYPGVVGAATVTRLERSFEWEVDRNRTPRHIGVAGIVRRNAKGEVISAAAQVGGVDQRRTGGIHFCHEGVE